MGPKVKVRNSAPRDSPLASTLCVSMFLLIGRIFQFHLAQASRWVLFLKLQRVDADYQSILSCTLCHYASPTADKQRWSVKLWE